jgi:hypothetical protein
MDAFHLLVLLSISHVVEPCFPQNSRSYMVPVKDTPSTGTWPAPPLGTRGRHLDSAREWIAQMYVAWYKPELPQGQIHSLGTQGGRSPGLRLLSRESRNSLTSSPAIPNRRDCCRRLQESLGIPALLAEPAVDDYPQSRNGTLDDCSARIEQCGLVANDFSGVIPRCRRNPN